MLTYTDIQTKRRKCLSITGLTFPEFHRLLPAFARSYEGAQSQVSHGGGLPWLRSAGRGRKETLLGPEQKL